MAQIEFDNVFKTYNSKKENQVQALEGASLSILQGESVAITGTSGAGKSTLLHIMGCLDYPTSGSYRLNDIEVDFSNGRKTAQIRNQTIGFVLQEFGLIPQHTVLQNVQVPLLFSNISYRKTNEVCMNILSHIGIEKLAKKKVNELSGGQKQRVAIARALINEPDILLADEPTGALDSKTTQEILSIFEELNQQGKTIVIVTHDMNIASHCKRHISVIDGKIQNED